MSLFKSREWWSTIAGEQEEFDLGCLCVANVDNSNTGHDKIVVGSFHGFLRIYNPHPAHGENGGWSGFRPEDVVCETNLQLPIIQIEAGKFVSGTENIHLAVLHPRKLSIHSLAASSGAVEHGTQYQLKQVYEHNLQRSACNFCYGPFGGVKGRDFICVQSMDGTVSIFEQESFAFSRYLPGALIPGPIAYVPRTDSIVTVSSSRQVENYKYQVLAVATYLKTKEESQVLKSGKKVVSDWVCNIGDQAIDLSVCSFGGQTASLYVLGERGLYILSDVGKLKCMKKLEYNPSCFIPYGTASDGTTNCLVATHTKTLMVYQDVTLKWAAQLTYTPVQVKVANFLELKGAVVTLDDQGHLECSYLGTDPAMFAPPTAEVREIDYVEMDHEMSQLQKVIKEQQHKAAPLMPTASVEDEIQITIQVPYDMDSESQARDANYHDEDPIPSVTVKIILKAKAHMSDVRVSIHTPPPLTASDTLIIFSSLEPSHPGEAQVTLYLKYNMLPSDLRAEVTANYQNTSGAPRVSHSVMKLPLKLVVKPCLPVKTANFKVTVDTNKAPVNLNELFPDLLGENAGGPGNALGFKYYGLEPVITVLASKTSQRYRLQCDEFEAMWLLLNELVNRLCAHFSSYGQKDFSVSYDGPLPLQEYFDVLDSHFECRLNAEKLDKLLEERAGQFRAVQRRLLTRFKDKTPAPLANLDTLLEGTYQQVLAIGQTIEADRHKLKKAAASLSCATYMLNLLVKLWQAMTEDEFAVLEGALSPDVCDNGQQGWEEMVDAAITHLLRTCLAKSAKDQTVNPNPLGMLKDTTKLKKHIALLCDRLSKGARLAVEGQQPRTSTSNRSNGPATSSAPHKSRQGKTPSQRNPLLGADVSTPQVDSDELPTGSKFGEKKKHRKGKSSGPTKTVDLLNGHGRQLEPLHEMSHDVLPLGGDPVMDAPAAKDTGGDLELYPSEGGRSGSDFLKKKKVSPTDDIPDLDDLEAPGCEDDDGDGGGTRLINGGNELVYGL